MKLIQLSVFVENKEGRISEVCTLLGENEIDIRALTVAESDGFGVLRMVVNKPNEALEVLKEGGFTARLTDIVAVEVKDTPGGLAEVLNILRTNNVNVEYMYGFVEKFSDKALLVFRFDDADKAISVLTENGVSVVRKDDIESI